MMLVATGRGVRRLGHSAAAEHLTHVLAEIAEGDAAIDRRLALPGVKVGASNDSPVQQASKSFDALCNPRTLKQLPHHGLVARDDGPAQKPFQTRYDSG
jgi:hypothetical protein